MMSKISYDGRKFAAVQNSETGEVNSDTVFHNHQSGSIVTADSCGGDIISGHLIAICDAEALSICVTSMSIKMVIS